MSAPGESDQGSLVLAATPIGNVSDASPRLRQLLQVADIVAAEDTRRLHHLAARLEVDLSGQVVSYHEHNEGRRTRELVDQVASGKTVLLVTDAGMPSVSDPGYRLVAACVDAGLHVTSAPGPSAAIAALAVSGLAVDRFCFEGFLPRKPGQRRERLKGLSREQRTMVFFEAPHRAGEVLADMAELWGESRRAAVCRELTKTYEEVKRGSLAELAKWSSGGLRGEITLVVAGAPDVVDLTDDELRQRVRALESTGLSRRDAVDAVAAETGNARRRVYAAANS
ncbi:MAG: 16S rRNA (cytidine(1402)-2'-O)-methyltransferase [Actinomycetes bacterium]